jgi:hypothetical protein
VSNGSLEPPNRGSPAVGLSTLPLIHSTSALSCWQLGDEIHAMRLFENSPKYVPVANQ